MQLRIAAVLSRAFKIPVASIGPDSVPHLIPAWDSAGHMMLLIELEKEFHVTFDDDEVVKMISVEAIANVLTRHGV